VRAGRRTDASEAGDALVGEHDILRVRNDAYSLEGVEVFFIEVGKGQLMTPRMAES